MDDHTAYFSNDNATFGDRVAAAREAQGLTHEDLAGRLGVKVETIRRWEDDIAEPRANKLVTLAGVLNVSMRWLLTAEGDGLDAPDDQVDMSGELNELLHELRRAKAEFARMTDHLGVLEKRLAGLLRAGA